MGKQLAIGAGAALLAVAIRYALPLSPIQLPTLLVVVATALVSTFVGTIAGATAAIVGGLASWWLFFVPSSGGLTRNGAIPLFGFAVIAAVIVTTSHLYRRSERRYHRAQLAALRDRAEAADLFAREQAHRLKNAMTIVQSIAFQTLDPDSADTAKFAARLKALADVHDLLSAHVETPTAEIGEVIESALAPLSGDRHRLDIAAPPLRIAGQQALILTLALHELGANALAHGALSAPAGRVSLSGRNQGDRIELVWKESGGPPPAASVRPGFGLRYIEKIGSGTELQFEPDGVRACLFLRRGAGR
ncbi:MAG TPA: HWE histidine kinase domain-containing protein [Allosphingosinicella sp.]|nr:HWE histidine kinase domain-containing protein [Allosphingosinicella sp.]